MYRRNINLPFSNPWEQRRKDLIDFAETYHGFFIGKIIPVTTLHVFLSGVETFDVVKIDELSAIPTDVTVLDIDEVTLLYQDPPIFIGTDGQEIMDTDLQTEPVGLDVWWPVLPNPEPKVFKRDAVETWLIPIKHRLVPGNQKSFALQVETSILVS